MTGAAVVKYIGVFHTANAPSQVELQTFFTLFIIISINISINSYFSRDWYGSTN